MKEVSSSKKAATVITAIYVGIGIILLIAVLTIGNRNPAARPFLTNLAKIYVSCVSIEMIVVAILRRKNVVIASVLGGMLFLYCLLHFILPMIFPS